MREIKFRGKRIDRDDEARWVYGHYFTTPLTDENSGLPADTGWFFLSGGEPMHCIEQDGVSFVIDVETLGEYTGLKDKNGNRIYEGDILDVVEPMGNSVYSSYGYVGTNSWVNHSRHAVEFTPSGLQLVDYYTRMKICEVIGNVYENPNLLQGEMRHVD